MIASVKVGNRLKCALECDALPSSGAIICVPFKAVKSVYDSTSPGILQYILLLFKSIVWLIAISRFNCMMPVDSKRM